MFRNPTVVILGAGASYEVGLPLGSELKQQISDALRFRFQSFKGQVSGDPDLFESIKRQVGEKEAGTYTSAANELSEVIPTFPSIDEALNYFSSRVEIIQSGKIAIVAEILKAERKSALRYVQSSPPAIAEADGTWLNHFFSLAMSSIRKEGIKDIFEKVTFINFNYDRVLEQYLYWALQKRALVEADMAASIVQNLNVIRPYGQIGPYGEINQQGLSFGNYDVGRLKFFELAAGIRTFAEQCATDIPVAIDEALNAARLVLMLGSGFHAQNMALLDPLTKRKTNAIQVFATAKGIHPLNHDMLNDQLRACMRTDRVSLYDMTSAAMLSELRASISSVAN
jgi:hypothetical protein